MTFSCAPAQAISIRRSIIAGVIGNIAEHYDTALFAFLAPYLAPLFFPTFHPTVGLILTYAMLALDLFAKPLGALAFGRIGDRDGRLKALALSIGGTAYMTFLIGCMPTYALVGWVAPVLLAAVRFVQKVCAAGECVGGAIFVLEQRSEGKNFLSSCYSASTILGILLASALVAAFDWMGWITDYWRCLFFLGGIANGVGAYIRNCALETAEFLDSSRHVQAADQQHILHQLWNYRWAFVAVICLSGFTYATYEIAFIFLNSFSPLVSKTTKLEAISLNTLLLLGDMLLLPLFGWMADRIAPARMMCAAAAAAFIGAIPLFQMCIGADLWMLGIIRAYWVLVGVVFCAPFHLSIQQLVPAHCRYTLLSLGYAIGSQLFGGPFTAVALWLFHRYPTPLAPALYVMAISLMTMVATCYRPAFKLSSAGCPVAAVKSA